MKFGHNKRNLPLLQKRIEEKPKDLLNSSDYIFFKFTIAKIFLNLVWMVVKTGH